MRSAVADCNGTASVLNICHNVPLPPRLASLGGKATVSAYAMRVAIRIRFICTGRLRTDRHRGNSRLESSYVGGSRDASVLPRADSGDISPIAVCLTARWAIGRGNGGIELNLLAKMLTHLFEPRPRVGAVDDASQEPQAFAGVVPIAPDILFGNFCI